jgi:Family of unknown function (DUF5320)
MPGFDRTGPMGEGPMTGGVRGYCNPGRAGNRPPMFVRGGGRGRGRGFRQGIGPWYSSGRGFGWGGYFPIWERRYSQGFSVPHALDASDELNMLKTEADAIKKDLEEINKRMEELEKEASE